MLDSILHSSSKYVIWACAGLCVAFLVLLVCFYSYRLNVAQERLQAASRELVALTSQLESYQLEQERLLSITATAGNDKAKSEAKTDAATAKAARVSRTVLTSDEFNILHDRANEVRKAAAAPSK